MEKFYITTAIDYVNSKPHLGHLYEKVCADTIARWHRLKKEDVFFLTGTDENAQKIDRVAKEKKIATKYFVDEMSKNFLRLCKRFNISYDDFIRTTEKRHIKVVQDIFKRMYDNGDIYKGKYEGLYCLGCEAFYLEKDLDNGRCKIHGIKAEVIKEDSYFFRLSKYQDRILKHFERNKDFVLPVGRRNEMIARIKEGLKDLSVSRYDVDWGIEIPFDKKSKVYVWKDALENYISALGYPNGKDFKKYWPAEVHVIGMDINFFHSVIWPAILMSLGEKLPKTIFVHGFIRINGEKMSKSRGMVVDPLGLAERYPIDGIRYFLMRETPFGQDGEFSEDALKARINNELANSLGNLVSRIISIAERKNNGKVAKDNLDKKLTDKLDLKMIEKAMDDFELNNALAEIFRFVNECNKYVNDEKPWEMKDKELNKHLYTLLESIRIIAILLSSFIPETSNKINKQLGIKEGNLDDCKFGLMGEYKVSKEAILFNKV